MERNLLLKWICLLLIIAGNSYGQTNLYSKVIYHPSLGINGNSICNAYDNGSYIVGELNFNPILLKIDSAGNFLWSKNFVTSNGTFNTIVPTNDSCFIIAGSIANTTTSNNDGFLVKINAIGDTLWTREIAQSNDSYIYAIQQTSDSGYVLTGYIQNTSAPYSTIFVTKTDNTGTVQWNQKINAGLQENYGFSIKQTPDGGYAVFATYEATLPFQMNAALIKLSPTGVIQWSKKYNEPASSDNSKAIDIDITPSGIYTYLSVNSYITFLKVDYLGTTLWTKKYNTYTSGFSNNAICSKLLKSSDGNYVCATGTGNLHQGGDIIKVDTSGNVIWTSNLQSDPIMLTEAKDSGYTILSTGPMYGVSRSSLPSYADQLGMIKTDSLGTGTTCINSSGAGLATNTITSTVITPTTTSGGATNNRKPITITTPSFITEVGCVTFTGGVQENLLDNVSIFPNPTTADFTISGLQGECTIKIYDATGKTILSTRTSQEKINLKLNQYAKGIYFYQIITKENSIKQGKISLQ